MTGEEEEYVVKKILQHWKDGNDVWYELEYEDGSISNKLEEQMGNCTSLIKKIHAQKRSSAKCKRGKRQNEKRYVRWNRGALARGGKVSCTDKLCDAKALEKTTYL